MAWVIYTYVMVGYLLCTFGRPYYDPFITWFVSRYERHPMSLRWWLRVAAIVAFLTVGWPVALMLRILGYPKKRLNTDWPDSDPQEWLVAYRAYADSVMNQIDMTEDDTNE